MIKHFCDVCEKEIQRNYVDERLVHKLRDFEVEMIVKKENTSNDGELCYRCLMNIVTNGKEV